MSGLQAYFRALSEHIGTAWNHFWFQPSDVFDLCVLRVLVGSLALGWQMSYLLDLTTWFGGEGWLASDAMQRVVSGGSSGVGFYDFSYLFWVSRPWLLWTVHFLGSLILLAFTVGCCTRWAAVASLVVLVSYVHRAPLLAGPAEPVLTMLVAYLCLAPVGQQVSWDRRRRGASWPLMRQSCWATVARRLIQVHLVMLYLVMGLTKLGGETWWYGEAIWWLAAQPDSQWFDPAVLRSYAVLLNLWTHAVVISELLFVVLIWNRWLRPLVLVGSAVSWISVAVATGYVGLSATMIVANFAFVSGEFWRNRLGSNPSIEHRAELKGTT